MYKPQYVQVPRKEHMVCKSIKALFGLKQAARAQYVNIDKDLQDNGFRRSFFDSNLYVKSEDIDVVMLVIYIDDIIIGGSEVGEITK